ncbi:phosphoribosylanthranilate isomerase [Chryseobacterium sp. IHB B 17019]|uniref:phosphoribosylanthranilate isomerase n=1 Tax=Chryseobacterium sp. IHB B 17019 TaxID=1721091 RepID=UPI001E61CCE8|nr:phosphoribosylanthranilate isomerase [Chryseobacterium sp. IHB B 17019]
MKLKICGLTRLNQIHELISMNTDFLGFIFYEKSPRYVLNHLNLNEISKIIHNGKTGVFVNESVNEIYKITEKANLNFIQLHGDNDENFISALRKKINPDIGVIKVIRISDGNIDLKNLIKKINNYLKLNINYLLFDTDSKAFGGTGKQFDWNILNEIEIPLPYFLSGGISEENIKHITILKQKPFAIDINSKFEIEAGVKDLNRIRKFKEIYKT